MNEKKENEIPSEKKKFVFNVDYKGTVNTDISIVAETKEKARQIIKDLYPEATISFLRIEESSNF